jgi:hypothetical protein
LSFDHYPILRKGLRGEWYENLEMVARLARDLEKPFWAFAMSVAHAEYPIPTVANLRLQVFSNLAYGAQMIQYFTYWTPLPPSALKFNNAPIDIHGNRTLVYDRVRQLNEEIRVLSGVFRGARVVHVGHTGDALPFGTQRFRHGSPIRSVRTEGVGAIVSILERESRRFLVIVNRDFSKPMPIAIHFDGTTIPSLVGKDAVARSLSGEQFNTLVAPGDVSIISWEMAR